MEGIFYFLVIISVILLAYRLGEISQAKVREDLLLEKTKNDLIKSKKRKLNSNKLTQKK